MYQSRKHAKQLIMSGQGFSGGSGIRPSTGSTCLFLIACLMNSISCSIRSRIAKGSAIMSISMRLAVNVLLPSTNTRLKCAAYLDVSWNPAKLE